MKTCTMTHSLIRVIKEFLPRRSVWIGRFGWNSI